MDVRAFGSLTLSFLDVAAAASDRDGPDVPTRLEAVFDRDLKVSDTLVVG